MDTVAGVRKKGRFFKCRIITGIAALTLAQAAPGATGFNFDLTKYNDTVQGIGMFLWAHMSAGIAQFDTLNVKYARLTRDGDSWAVMQSFRALSVQKGIKWDYTLWRAPNKYCTNEALTNPAGFAQYWKTEIDTLNTNGCKPEYIDLLNEPDGDISWATHTPPDTLRTLIKDTRRVLDSSGYRDVGILAPNLSSTSWSHPAQYLAALDTGAIRACAAWCTHTWADDVADSICRGGAPCQDQAWVNFGPNARKDDSTKQVWVTEYGSKQFTYDGVTYPDPDTVGGYNLTFTMNYACRVYENTLDLFKLGANILLFWDAADDKGSSKQWGLIDQNGNKKCLYYTLVSLYPYLKAGAHVIQPATMDDTMYAGVFTHDTTVVVGIDNCSNKVHTRTMQLSKAGSQLAVSRTIYVQRTVQGNPASKTPDQCQTTTQSISLVSDGGGAYHFTITMAPYSTCTVLLSTASAARIAARPNQAVADLAAASYRGVLEVFDMSGQKIREVPASALRNVALEGAVKVPRGVYVYRISEDGRTLGASRIMIIK